MEHSLGVFLRLRPPKIRFLMDFGASSMQKSLKNHRKNSVFRFSHFLQFYASQNAFFLNCGSLGSLFGASGSSLGAPWERSDALLGRLGPLMCPLGAPLLHVCLPHGASWRILGRLGAAGASLLDLLARFWGVSGARFGVS